jgi:drug/metabolite transporter (DMT)-like permease
MGIPFHGSNIKLLSARGLLGALSLTSNFFAIGKISFINAAALQELAPIFVIIFAAIFLRERLSQTYVYLSICAFTGYLFIVYPDPDSHISATIALVTLGGAISSALAYVCVRKLSASDHPLLIMLYFFSFCTLTSIPITFSNFVLPTFMDIFKFIGISIFSFLGQGCMTIAYAREKAGIVAIISYSLIFYHLILGMIIWDEIPTISSLIGASLIVLSGILVNILRGRRVSEVK